MATHTNITNILDGFAMVPSARALGLPEKSGAGGAGGGSSGAEGAGGTSPLPGQIRANVALDEITRMYRDLVDIATKMERTYGLIGLGNRMPCKQVNLYNDAVRNYWMAAQSVFQQIAAQNPDYNIVQTTYDKRGQQVMSKAGTIPLMPPTIQQADCNRAPMLLDSGQLGNLGEVFTLGGILVITIIAAATGLVAIKITDMIINRPVNTLDAAEVNMERLRAKQTCTERRIAQYTAAKQKVPSVEAIDEFCETGVGPEIKPDAPRDTAWWWWAALGAGAVVSGLLLAKYLWRRDEFSGYAVDDYIPPPLPRKRKRRRKQLGCSC
jgi:hypothetical protein